MRKKMARGGIERKFITSIIWVGVIPMVLALIIGYVFAREGQQIAVRQNLNTAARTISGGIRLALLDRLKMAEHLASDPGVVAALQQHEADDPVTAPEVLLRIAEQRTEPGDFPTTYIIYDAEGQSVVDAGGPRDAYVPLGREWLEVTEPTFASLKFFGDVGRYATRIITPIHAPQGDERLGFLEVTEDMQPILQFLRGRSAPWGEEVSDENRYELIYFADDREFVVYLDRTDTEGVPRPMYHTPDPRLVERLQGPQSRPFDAFFEWQYTTRGETMPALMAYHRLDPLDDLYLLVYRSSKEVFQNINLAAILTLVVSSMVIGLFCIVAYRIVNNNIIRPVSLLNEGAQIIRQGDLDLKLVIGTGDEIEELAKSFNKMATALRHNISQLEASEERYRSLFTSMRDGIYQTDADGIITLINPAGLEILGYKEPEEVINLSMKALFVEELDYARVMQDLERNRFVERARVWMRKATGRSICVELAMTSVYDEGTLIGMEGTLRDVTQNVRLEQEARERSERISAINQIANAINSSLEAGRVYESITVEVRKLVSFDYAAVALLQDQQNAEGDAEETTFLTRQMWPEWSETVSVEGGKGQVLGRNVAAWVSREGSGLIAEDLDRGNHDFRGDFPANIRSCLCVPLHATGRIIGTLMLGSEEPGAFTRHEEDVLVQMSPHVAVAIRNASLLENIQRTLEEVTRAQEKLHEANEELKTLDEMKTNLLSNVSHELRTPLVAVMGYTDMILNRKVGGINDVQEEYLQISLRNIEKLVTLIENLLDFSRLHRGDEDMLFDTFDLVDCARNSVQSVLPLADSRGIKLILNTNEEEVLVEGDKGKMGQVFNNLLSNGVKFNAPEGNVTIEMKVTETDVEVCVSDTGIGIPKDECDKIFTRFYQVDSSSTRKYGGTGIGLAIVQDIVRLHGSTISVSSEEKKGTQFRFVLPLSPVQRVTDTHEQPRSLPLPTETHLLIELVTQDRAMSNQIRSQLLSEGMDVIHAAYPAVAIGLANKYSPDCILVDTEAGPLGSVVVDELLSDPSAGVLPIILLTNDDDLYDRYKGVVAGRVRRSFRKSTLLGGIHYALSRGLPEGEALGHRILCVDDDPEILKFIARCLESEGYEVDRCSSGEEALDLVDQGRYGLVLLDIAMPGLDGWETCRKFRENPALAGLKVYMVTAKPIDQTGSQVHRSGADGYLMKPFKPEELLALVGSFPLSPTGDVTT
jgi:PAS domain S-box-containing protein